MSVLNNVATADRFTDAATLRNHAPAHRLRYRVRNAAIYRQFGYGLAGGSVDWSGDEVLVYEGADDSLDESERPFIAVRFCSGTPGLSARVTAEAF